MPRGARLVLAAAALPAWLCAAASARATALVSNVAPKVDSQTGQVLDIHDGTTLRVGERFFWFGASYGGCVEPAGPNGCAGAKVGSCGFQLNHTVSLATSTDLVTWTLAPAPVLPVSARPPGILFSPWVARSASTGLYVLWVNILPVVNDTFSFDAAYYAVFTSPNPEGPYALANANVTGLAYTRLPDAASVFVDAGTGAGYLAFTHEDSHINNVQELTPDLIRPKPGGALSPQIGGGNNEGIAMFQRGGLYYVVYGQCSCFGGAGSNVEVHVATTPAGVYNRTGDIMPTSAWRAQTGSIWWTGADWVLQGDRWQSAPDRIKAHDFSYLSRVQFTADGGVVPVTAFEGTVEIAY